jgi:hypothetical protein
MKNKNIYIIGGLAVSGVLAYFFFFRKNKSLSSPLPPNYNILPKSGSASSSPTGSSDAVLDSSNIKQEDTTKEEFEFYKGKYNDLLAQIREVEAKRDRYTNKRDCGQSTCVEGAVQYQTGAEKRYYQNLIDKEQKKIDDFNLDLRNTEQTILDLGYLMTNRGTFYNR